METFNQLPVYKIKFNPDDESIEGIDLISFVKDPAIMRKGIKLNAQFKFSLDDEKMIVVAPALIPDLPIFRRDQDGKEYYITFTKDTIEGLVKKFNKNIKSGSLNVDHSEVIAPAYILESWIKEDEVYDKSVKYGFNDVPVGSWFLSAQITDKEFWNNQVKNEGKFGFSIEGFLDLELSKYEIQMKILSDTVESSNVKSYKYDTDRAVLVLEFNDGTEYEYKQVNFARFLAITGGAATCVTSGENKYGSWYVGKNPSVGAAVHEYLINSRIPYRKLSLSPDQEMIDGIIEILNQVEDLDNRRRMAIQVIIDFEEEGLLYDKEDFLKRIGLESLALNQPCQDCFIEVNPGETEQEYISRCMGSNKMNDEYPDQSQRFIVCKSKWDKSRYSRLYKYMKSK